MMLLTALGGCMAPSDHSPWTHQAHPENGPPVVPGVQGSWGTPVPMIGPSPSSPPGVGLTQNNTWKPGMPLDMMSPGAGGTMVAQAPAQAPSPPSFSSGIVQAGGVQLPNNPSGVTRAGGLFGPNSSSGVVQASASGLPTPPALPPGMTPPPGIVPAAAPPGVSPMPPMQGMPPMGGMPMPGQHNMPVLAPGMTMPGMPGMGMPGMGMPGMGMPGMGMPGMGMPGMGMPGMGMPGPNGIMPVSCPPPGAVALAAGAGMPPGNGCCPPPVKRTEIRFAGPAGMKVAWYTCGPDGHPTFAGNQLEAPGRYNFIQGAIFRLKLSDIPGRPGVDLYPTLEIVPSNFKTEAFLAHSAVPVYFTEEDLDQIAGGNYLVKVIYLPFPQYADVATTGPDEIVSTRLEPGADPIAEACKRGSILVVVRVGNIDLEAPNTPAMDAQPNHAGMGPMGPMGPGPMPPAMARMPAPPPGMPVGRPGPMLPNGGQMPAAPLNAPGGPVLQPAAPQDKPAGPVTQLPDAGSPLKPTSYPAAK
jgi:hypothetical protein